MTVYCLQLNTGLVDRLYFEITQLLPVLRYTHNPANFSYPCILTVNRKPFKL